MTAVKPSGWALSAAGLSSWTIHSVNTCFAPTRAHADTSGVSSGSIRYMISARSSRTPTAAVSRYVLAGAELIGGTATASLHCGCAHHGAHGLNHGVWFAMVVTARRLVALGHDLVTPASAVGLRHQASDCTR